MQTSGVKAKGTNFKGSRFTEGEDWKVKLPLRLELNASKLNSEGAL
jgi:hypothetical protein